MKVEYYGATTKKWGALEGIVSVSEEEARHRRFTCKFYRRGPGGPVEKVELVNGHGQLTQPVGITTVIDGWTGAADLNKRSACRYEFKRNQEGQVIEEIASDRNGTILWILHYTSNKGLAYYTDEGGWPAAHAPSGAAYVKFIRDEEGHDKEVTYLDLKQANPDECFGRFSGGGAGRAGSSRHRWPVCSRTLLGHRQ